MSQTDRWDVRPPLWTGTLSTELKSVLWPAGGSRQTDSSLTLSSDKHVCMFGGQKLLHSLKIFNAMSTQTGQWAPGFYLVGSTQYEPWELRADSSGLSLSRLVSHKETHHQTFTLRPSTETKTRKICFSSKRIIKCFWRTFSLWARR